MERRLWRRPAREPPRTTSAGAGDCSAAGGRDHGADADDCSTPAASMKIWASRAAGPGRRGRRDLGGEGGKGWRWCRRRCCERPPSPPPPPSSESPAHAMDPPPPPLSFESPGPRHGTSTSVRRTSSVMLKGPRDVAVGGGRRCYISRALLLPPVDGSASKPGRGGRRRYCCHRLTAVLRAVARGAASGRRRFYQHHTKTHSVQNYVRSIEC